MSMLLIKGTFRVPPKSKPDGDTVPFIPDNVADWKLVPGCKQIVPAADGRVSVRLESVDALETHYEGAYGPEQHQPLDLAHRAANELLAWVGFASVDRHEDETVATIPESVPGFILTGGSDIYGRCVALVGRGTPPAASGYEIRVDQELLKKTANFHLISLGLVYPTFYSAFPRELREFLTTETQKARAAKKGVWADDVDVTMKGAKITGMPSITAADGAVILPKLFRRLKEYLDLKPYEPLLNCFPSYLAGAGDRFRITSEPEEKVGLHRVVEVINGHTVRMTRQPEELVFDEK
ncbi:MULTISPECIES: thermonuclease family protein [unclassified Streptomyces]|uniref:thermonuclease family protein n=1 Tax=unclassified Streptomyces TaxID=2593676 RepID=UPI00214B96EB|nr:MULTISPECIES: thermonuclease family protein [unclassified Streptomyces]MCX5608308.1 thermonuclease family protein [Streptomyces sp. NBC_00047]UUU42323.1 thermonuclease family protein [Streptomyces sp. NBC_00162]